MIRNRERKRTKVDENDEQTKPSLTKSFSRHASPALSLKTNQRDQKTLDYKKFPQLKEKQVPQKRTVTVEEQQIKRRGVERTFRRREEEIEWSPVGLDLDFSGLDSTAQPYSTEPVFVEPEPKRIERGFHTMESMTDKAEEEKEEEEEEEEDWSTVEYAPPKEKELPYLPPASCIMDYSSFSPFADQDAYELTRLSKPYLDDLIYEEDILHSLTPQSIVEEFDASDLEPESDDLGDLDFSSIPFQDHQLDVDYYLEMHC
ncbi:hypothetical protein BD560DRAFT_400790 [Blakeslea trispora]|nr:hypothetical protein BD560DRAFT_400790 [Blakeslea trispora]